MSFVPEIKHPQKKNNHSVIQYEITSAFPTGRSKAIKPKIQSILYFENINIL